MLLVLAVLFSGLGLFFLWIQKQKREATEQESAHFTAGLLIVGSVYLHILLWLSLHATALSDDIATMISLVLYTIIGLGAYFYGKMQEKKIVRIYGAVLLTLVVVRLLVVDVWDMALAGRIVTFFLVGILLTTTAFVGRGKKVLSVLLVVGAGGILAYASSVDALSTISQETISAYQELKELQPVSIIVPTVVEMPFENEELERFGFAVLDEATDSFQPLFFKQETSINELPITISATNQSAIDSARMIDRDAQTYTAFALPEETQGSVRIVVASARTITSSSLTLLLDSHVALPTSIEIRAQVDSANDIVLAKTPMRQTTVHFPRTTSARWTITLTYAQPLRISELKLAQENAARTSSHALRFLAQPGHSYQIYFNPDRYVSPAVREAGNLADNQGVLNLPSPPSQTNVYYKQADVDADGVPDILDNCVATSNTDQADVNSNGRGDACDDFDRDGIINSQDNCPSDPNRGQTDVDADGIGDACDMEESRLTERYKWLPWIGIAFAALTLIVLFALTARATMRKRGDNQPPAA
ncbi:MAG: thrombospondin type 3 repeat-containing protein [Candidatus Wildermuthbacteria bacterium]|nr:thrombospondin type 3 repeat-containing protein [Candidatus Wildermuthbacteria bacterium]